MVYKSGSTEAGQKAASSHTGTLAGSYGMTVDLLRQAAEMTFAADPVNAATALD